MPEIRAVAGEDIDFAFTVYDAARAPQNLTGGTFICRARARGGGAVVITGTVTTPLPLTGQVFVTLPAVATAGFRRAQTLWLEVQATLSGKKRIVFRRRLRLLPSIMEA